MELHQDMNDLKPDVTGPEYVMDASPTRLKQELAALNLTVEKSSAPWSSAVRCHLSANQKKEMVYTTAND
ncbi:hypothetical protein EYF80_043665 [Liparis tanakae]|uniref:Uncharacterized protein n=1 Tax=Liparis tanakae TaxID=230148 RepID=A0A4Z2FY14_9TELE|nr:hypothetical protein EYF80_043665 [Liparis tanakae]